MCIYMGVGYDSNAKQINMKTLDMGYEKYARILRANGYLVVSPKIVTKDIKSEPKDSKFRIGIWYEWTDTLGGVTHSFKVTGFVYDTSGKARIRFQSTSGVMENIDRDEDFPDSFPTGCVIYDDSEPMRFERKRKYYANDDHIAFES